MKKLSGKCNDELLDRERSRFINWVNGVVKEYLGLVIDEFRVTFDLDKSSQSHINKWLMFALTKQVKSLELNLQPARVFRALNPGCTLYTLSLECYKPLELPHNLASIKPALTSLCLKYVNISEEVLEYLLCSFPILEKLCIERSEYLTSIKASLQLKHLDISKCPDLKTIDISATKLLSFRYCGLPIELHIRNASFLSEVSIGSARTTDVRTFAFDSLTEYFSQLEYLSLQICLFGKNKLSSGINHFPAFTNLRHLELCFCK